MCKTLVCSIKILITKETSQVSIAAKSAEEGHTNFYLDT